MVKISTLELENVKRIKAVSLAPAESGLTVIGAALLVASVPISGDLKRNDDEKKNR